MSTKILGLDRLNKKLSGLPIAARLAIRKAMSEAADEIVAMMKRLVPVDDGDLRDSIAWTWGSKPKYAQSVASIRATGSEDVITIYVGNTKVRYAHLVEFGSAPHINGGEFAGTKHPGTAAQPFFFVSWRALRKKSKSRITRAINKSAKLVASRS